MYTFLLSFHNLNRWIVIIIGALAIIRAYRGFSRQMKWTSQDRWLGIAYVALLDLQALSGILLYIFFSPSTKSLFRDFGAAMGDPNVRYFSVTHVFVMAIALVFAHLGVYLSKRTASDYIRFRTTVFVFFVSLFLILNMIPWPFMEYGRPFFRFPGG